MCYLSQQETHAIRNSRMRAMFRIRNKLKMENWESTEGIHLTLRLATTSSEQPKLSETGWSLLSRSKHPMDSTVNNICKITVLLKLYVDFHWSTSTDMQTKCEKTNHGYCVKYKCSKLWQSKSTVNIDRYWEEEEEEEGNGELISSCYKAETQKIGS